MKLECINPNGEIVLGGKLNHVVYKNCIQKWILQVIFLWKCSKCPKHKIVHKFLITNPNGMNKSSPNRQKYNLWRKKFKFLQFFCCPFSFNLSLFWYNYCSQVPIEKYIFPRSLSVFLSSKNVSKNHNKNSALRYLPKIPFVPQMDNGPLGVNSLTMFSPKMLQNCHF